MIAKLGFIMGVQHDATKYQQNPHDVLVIARA